MIHPILIFSRSYVSSTLVQLRAPHGDIANVPTICIMVYSAGAAPGLEAIARR